jgi:hypothetical protein
MSDGPCHVPRIMKNRMNNAQPNHGDLPLMDPLLASMTQGMNAAEMLVLADILDRAAKRLDDESDVDPSLN